MVVTFNWEKFRQIDANPVDNFNSTEMVPVPTPVVHNSGLIFQPMEEPKVDENMETEVQI
jgi:hypothetical protein